MSEEIFLDAPNVGAEEKRYLNQAIDAGEVSTIGKFIKQFEKEFACFLNVKDAVSVQSGTAALHLALYELGIGPGDEVIVPALTFVATVNPVSYVGATPVFVDVDPVTWNIAPTKIEEAITNKTKAVIPVHLYGNPCRMDKIMEIARKYNIYVIEDASESLGAVYDKEFTGTIGDFGCFSFNGNKIITTGGGGMITGNNTKRLEHVRFLSNQARDEAKGYFNPEIGFNYRMTNIEAAMGLAQMKKLENFLKLKKEFTEIYHQELGALEQITFQKEYPHGKSSNWLCSALFNEKTDIVQMQLKLKEKGIPTRRVFMPVTEFPPYQKFHTTELENSYNIYRKGLCLAGSTLNTSEDIRFVCHNIKKLL